MLLPEVLILTILIGIRSNLRVILICISLNTKEFEHLFRCFTVIQDSSIVKSWFSSPPHVLIALFGFLVISFLSSLYILGIRSLLDVGLVKIFFPICRVPICLIDYVHCLTESLKFHEVPLINS